MEMPGSSKRTSLLVLLAVVSLTIAACTGAGVDETTVIVTTSSTAQTTTTTAPVTTTTIPGTTTTTPPETTTTSPTTTTTTLLEPDEPPTITIEDGRVVGGPQEISAEVGSEVGFVVISDVAEEIHVHGYDLFFDLIPGEPAEVTFTADIPGIFEIELEGSHQLIFELEVR